MKVNSVRIWTVLVNFERRRVELECREAMGRSRCLRVYQPARADDKVAEVISEPLFIYEKQRVKHQRADIPSFKDKAGGSMKPWIRQGAGTKPSGRILADLQRSSTPGVTRKKNKLVPWTSL